MKALETVSGRICCKHPKVSGCIRFPKDFTGHCSKDRCVAIAGILLHPGMEDDERFTRTTKCNQSLCLAHCEFLLSLVGL